jgi:hypothetical protein
MRFPVLYTTCTNIIRLFIGGLKGIHWIKMRPSYFTAVLRSVARVCNMKGNRLEQLLVSNSWVYSRFLVVFMFSIFRFLCSVVSAIVCPFVPSIFSLLELVFGDGLQGTNWGSVTFPWFYFSKERLFQNAQQWHD